REFLFKHALLRDVTYESVLLRDRAELHARAARWLERHAGERAREYLGVIAEHHRLAGNRARAASLLAGLGTEALQAGDPVVARRTFEPAIELDASAVDVAAVQAALGDALVFLGELDVAKQAYRDALEPARTAGDLDVQIRALCGLARVTFLRGEYVEN